jgi:hypothetical protein
MMNIIRFFATYLNRIMPLFSNRVYFGRHPGQLPDNTLIFFPLTNNIINCALTGIVSYKKRKN